MVTGKKQAKPPYSNTGAENTLESGLKPCVDWLQATFKNVQPEQIIEDVLLENLDNFVKLDKGRYGYRSALKYGHITIYYNGHAGMGVHLEMTGQGCREFENRGVMDWQTFFKIVLACEASFTRIDLALDDHKGYWKISTLKRKAKNGEVISKFKSAMGIEKIRLEDGKTIGETLYFGSNSSMIKVRFYDKRLEQIGKGEAEHEIEHEIWNRTEIQLRDDRAQATAQLIAADEPLGKIITGILKHYMRFAVKSKDKNRSRWKTAKFWDEFLNDVEPLRLAITKPDSSIEQKIEWLRKQTSKTLAMVLKAEGGDMAILYEILHEGSQKIKEKDLALINEYWAKEKAYDLGGGNRHKDTDFSVSSSI